MSGASGGDTVNFAFITVFLIFWCLPMTAVLIQIGTDGVASREKNEIPHFMTY